MKLVKSSFEIIEQGPGVEGIYKIIEQAGRTCYKSEDKITEDSSKSFVDRIIASNHGAVLEQGTIYLDITESNDIISLGNFFRTNPYSRIYKDTLESLWDHPHLYVTTNYRVLVEHFDDNLILKVLQYLCKPTKFHSKKVAVKFILPIGISREFCRHRAFSFIEMSTRYCNFSKDKFSNEITFIEDSYSDPDLLQYIEEGYMKAIKEGKKPQEARNILPLCTKTELIMTGFISDWMHFFELRNNKYGRGGAHPQADELATSLYEEFIKRDYIKQYNKIK